MRPFFMGMHWGPSLFCEMPEYTIILFYQDLRSFDRSLLYYIAIHLKTNTGTDTN